MNPSVHVGKEQPTQEELNFARDHFDKGMYIGMDQDVDRISNQTLIELTASDDWWESARAVSILGVRRCKEAVPTITEAINKFLEGEEAVPLDHHFEAIKRIGSDANNTETISILKKVLLTKDPAGAQWLEAAYALGAIGSEEAFNTLLDALESDIKSPISEHPTVDSPTLSVLATFQNMGWDKAALSADKVLDRILKSRSEVKNSADREVYDKLLFAIGWSLNDSEWHQVVYDIEDNKFRSNYTISTNGLCKKTSTIEQMTPDKFKILDLDYVFQENRWKEESMNKLFERKSTDATKTPELFWQTLFDRNLHEVLTCLAATEGVATDKRDLYVSVSLIDLPSMTWRLYKLGTLTDPLFKHKVVGLSKLWDPDHWK